jgi:hypothetical protein
MLTSHFREEPEGHGSGITIGLIGVIGDVLDGIDEITIAGKVELSVLAAVVLADFVDEAASVEGAAVEDDRKGLVQLGIGTASWN